MNENNGKVSTSTILKTRHEAFMREMETRHKERLALLGVPEEEIARVEDERNQDHYRDNLV